MGAEFSQRLIVVDCSNNKQWSNVSEFINGYLHFFLKTSFRNAPQMPAWRKVNIMTTAIYNSSVGHRCALQQTTAMKKCVFLVISIGWTLLNITDQRLANVRLSASRSSYHSTLPSRHSSKPTSPRTERCLWPLKFSFCSSWSTNKEYPTTFWALLPKCHELLLLGAGLKQAAKRTNGRQLKKPIVHSMPQRALQYKWRMSIPQTERASFYRNLIEDKIWFAGTTAAKVKVKCIFSVAVVLHALRMHLRKNESWSVTPVQY